MTGKTLDLSNEVTAPNHYDAHTDIEQATIYTLASYADCASPDSSDSPGAGFLNAVRTMVLESWAEAMPSDERGDVSELLDVDWADTAHTIADGAPSIYTYELWTQFVDLAAWQELDEAIEEGLLNISSDNPTFTIPAVCLYSIARRLALVLLESLVDALQLDVDNFEESDDEADDES